MSAKNFHDSRPNCEIHKNFHHAKNIPKYDGTRTVYGSKGIITVDRNWLVMYRPYKEII